jgi:hypothetical protein
LSLADIDRAYAQVRVQVTEETTVCDEMLSRLAAQASGMLASTARCSRYDVFFGLLAEANEVAAILDGSIRFPADPTGVHQAWLQLNPDQRAQLLAGTPGRFGNLNGIPAADRNIANRATVDAQLLLLAKACEEVGIAIPNRPEDFDRMPPTLFRDGNSRVFRARSSAGSASGRPTSSKRQVRRPTASPKLRAV